MILFFNRILNKIRRSWQLRVFRAYTHNKKNKINLVGKMTLINPNVHCGNNITFYPDVMLFGDGNIDIGDNVDIGQGTIIYASKNNGGVFIGDNSMIAGQCYIIDTDHGIKRGENINKQENTVAVVEIGKDVWIGAGVKILKGSRIGDGAIIGAGAVVKGNIPENAIAVGVPAKVIKYRE